jgi:hypothetical protein
MNPQPLSDGEPLARRIDANYFEPGREPNPSCRPRAPAKADRATIAAPTHSTSVPVYAPPRAECAVLSASARAAASSAYTHSTWHPRALQPHQLTHTRHGIRARCSLISLHTLDMASGLLSRLCGARWQASDCIRIVSVLVRGGRAREKRNDRSRPVRMCMCDLTLAEH